MNTNNNKIKKKIGPFIYNVYCVCDCEKNVVNPKFNS